MNGVLEIIPAGVAAAAVVTAAAVTLLVAGITWREAWAGVAGGGRRWTWGPVFLLAVLAGDQILTTVKTAFSFGIIPPTPQTVGLVAPLLNAQPLLTYGALGILLLFPAHTLWTARGGKEGGPTQAGASGNAAQKRLRRAVLRRRRRLAVAGLVATVSVVLVLAGRGVVERYAQAAESLSPAQPVMAEGGRVRVPTENLEAGEMSRYGYEAKDGTEVRFLVVHKGSQVYEAVLDACTICGPAGYYQKGENDVVCRACDVPINVPTIGFPGGCNPIPLESEPVPQGLAVNAGQLEDATGKFR